MPEEAGTYMRGERERESERQRERVKVRDNFKRSVLFFQLVASRDGTQASALVASLSTSSNLK